MLENNDFLDELYSVAIIKSMKFVSGELKRLLSGKIPLIDKNLSLFKQIKYEFWSRMSMSNGHQSLPVLLEKSVSFGLLAFQITTLASSAIFICRCWRHYLDRRLHKRSAMGNMFCCSISYSTQSYHNIGLRVWNGFWSLQHRIPGQQSRNWGGSFSLPQPTWNACAHTSERVCGHVYRVRTECASY